MGIVKRFLENKLHHALDRGKSILLLGARQTGKTTLINQIKSDFSVSLVQPQHRQRYERNPELLTAELEALWQQSDKKKPIRVIIDEVQKIPRLMDVAQDLIDRQIAQFILTGSSARKLKRPGEINLLPGRVVALQLDPLMTAEFQEKLPTIENLLYDGSLPGIALTPNANDREVDLQTYATTYLEAEVRAEALVRNLSDFGRFLELAASESGNALNFSKLAKEIGVAHATVASYYQILEDCLMVERVEPLIQTKTRRKLTKTQKYIFFDLGIRRACAKEGRSIPISYLGHLFEQWVGLELIRLARLPLNPTRIHFWRDLDGPEIDWVIQNDHELIPIEVKWTESPTLQDARHLQPFLKEYEQAKRGFVVCRCPHPLQLSENIQAIPWKSINQLIPYDLASMR